MENMERLDRKFWKNKKVLVTGHTGFKGAWASFILNHLGCKVYACALKPKKNQILFNQLNLQNILEKKAHSLSNGNDIKLSSFGSFLIKRKKSRMGRNPKTKIEAVISERNVVIFRPSMQLKNKINTD